MKDLIQAACRQADAALEAALGELCPIQSRFSPRGTIANPFPRISGRDGEELAGGISLGGTFLEAVSHQGGFLNFTLGSDWYDAALKLPLQEKPFPPLPPCSLSFSAQIHPEDWAFAGKQADPQRCARQDAANPGWLVRITEQRLRSVEPFAKEDVCWTDDLRRLLLQLAALEGEKSAGRLSLQLGDAARLIWQIGPHRLPAPLNRLCRVSLHNGRAVIYRKFTLSPHKGVE